MNRRFPVRRPTEQAALAAASRSARRALPATVQQLRARAVHAVQTDDGHGLRLITARLARCA